VKFGELVQAMVEGDVPPAPVMELVGMRITEVEPGRTVFELEAGPQHANPMGTLHGGILADVAPTALALLGIEQPQEMTGRSLIRQR